VHAVRRVVQILTFASLVALAGSGCTPAGGGPSGGNRIVTPPPAAKPSGPLPTPNALEPAPTTTTTSTGGVTTRLRGEGMSSAQLYTAYRAILDQYVDPVDDTVLIKAATD
jgi:hypothetical protein